MNRLPQTARHLLTAAALSSLGMGLVACGEDAQAVETKRELGEAADATGELMKQKWSEMMNQSDQQMAQLRARYEELKNRASEAEGEARATWEKQKADLEVQIEKLSNRLEEARSQGEQKAASLGADLKAGFEEANERLSKAAEALQGN